MAKNLTKTDIAKLKLFVNNGDANGYYNYLVSKGDAYSKLALGVVNANTAAGAAARQFAENVGKITGMNTSISSAEWASITQGLIAADLVTREILLSRGELALNLKYQDIRDYHRDVFIVHSLPITAWTAYVPVEQGGGNWHDIVASANSGTLTQWLSALGTTTPITIGALGKTVINFATGNESTNSQALWLEAMFFGGGEEHYAKSAVQAFITKSGNLSPFVIKSISGGVIMGGSDGSNAMVNADKAKAVMLGYRGNDVMSGNKGDDTIYGGEGHDKISGAEGKDQLFGGKGNDTIFGGENSDSPTNDKDTIYGGEGNDSIYSRNDNDTIYGEQGKDTISGGIGNDTIYGDHTDATMLKGGYGGSVLLYNDTLYGFDGDDRIYGGKGNDSIEGGKGHDTIYGGTENDWIYSYEDNDVIYGEQGKDTISGGVGNDTIYGDHTDATMLKGGYDGDVLQYNDTLYGFDGDDKIYGGKGNDSIEGGKGHDTIYGGTENDWIYSYEDNDVIYGEQGKDTISGGVGNDIIYGDHTDAGVKNYTGNVRNYDDLLYGFDGNDRIWGGKGNDDIWGGAGNDTLYGGDGDDVIRTGSSGIKNKPDVDVINAGAGNDKVHIGFSSATLTLGSGKDTVIFDHKGSWGNPGVFILDMTAEDRLDFSAIANDIAYKSAQVEFIDNTIKLSLAFKSFQDWDYIYLQGSWAQSFIDKANRLIDEDYSVYPENPQLWFYESSKYIEKELNKLIIGIETSHMTVHGV